MPDYGVPESLTDRQARHSAMTDTPMLLLAHPATHLRLTIGGSKWTAWTDACLKPMADALLGSTVRDFADGARRGRVAEATVDEGGINVRVEWLG
jgi:hypothetical protein